MRRTWIVVLVAVGTMGCGGQKFVDDCLEELGYERDQVVDVIVDCPGYQGQATFGLEVVDWVQEPCGPFEIDCQHAARGSGYISTGWTRLDGDTHITAVGSSELVCNEYTTDSVIHVELVNDAFPGYIGCWGAGTGELDCHYRCRDYWSCNTDDCREKAEACEEELVYPEYPPTTCNAARVVFH